MIWDWENYSTDSDAEDVSLLISNRSQQIILSALSTMDKREEWQGTDTELWNDADWDDIEAALAEAYEEIMEVQMSDGVPVGAIVAYPSTTMPTAKWIMCAGYALEQADYPALFALLGTTFGPTVGTAFVIPYLHSQVIYGTAIENQIADTGGAETHTLTIAEMPAHTHNFVRANDIGNNAFATVEGGTQGASTTLQATQVTGGDTAHNNMPPFLKLVYMIKALP